MNPVQYTVTLTDSGKWLQAGFLFGYIKNDWKQSTKNVAKKAFEDALSVSDEIKKAVQQTSGEKVVDGLYLLDKKEIIKAMTSIDGMSQTENHTQKMNGNNTAFYICKAFFELVLAGLSGGVEAIMPVLMKNMTDFKGQISNSNVKDKFGTVIGIVNVLEEIDLAVISFNYVYSSKEVSQWLVDIDCASVSHYQYDFDYLSVGFNYNRKFDDQDEPLPGPVKVELEKGPQS